MLIALEFDFSELPSRFDALAFPDALENSE